MPLKGASVRRFRMDIDDPSFSSYFLKLSVFLLENAGIEVYLIKNGNGMFGI